MRVLVAAAFEAGAMRAHVVNTVKTAEAFGRLGHEVTLLCRMPAGRRVTAPDELARMYGLRERVRWALLRPRWCGKPVGTARRFALAAMSTVMRARPKLIFARNYDLPALSSRLGWPTVAESHAHPGNEAPGLRRMARAARRPAFRSWVTISPHLAEHYESMGVPAAKLLVLPDGVDLALFARPGDVGESPYGDGGGARIVYAGHLYDYKGIPTILGAAVLLPEVAFHLVGGLPEDVERQRRRAADLGLANVTFHGPQPHATMPRHLWHADVLLLPPSRNHPSARWTSPLKLGEYLASERPVVASDIPALRHWLTGDDVEFVAPDDAAALAAGIRRVLGDPRRASAIVRAGAEVARRLAYEERVKAILAHATRTSRVDFQTTPAQ